MGIAFFLQLKWNKKGNLINHTSNIECTEFIFSIRPLCINEKNNDNALSLIFQMANEQCNIINNAGKINALSLILHYF